MTSLSLSDERMEALDRYFDMKEMKPRALTTGGILLVAGSLIVFFVFKKKYPYFSEKKYSYIKKYENEYLS